MTERKDTDTGDTGTPDLHIIDGGKALNKLTGKQSAFVRAILKGENQSDAYRSAYNAENMSDQAIWTEAGRLFRHPQVSRRIAKGRAAQERQAVHTGASLRLHVEKELFELSTKADTDQAKIRSLELLGKLDKVGAFTERVSTVSEQQSPEEIRAELKVRLRAFFDEPA